jgi:hypothetical protein
VSAGARWSAGRRVDELEQLDTYRIPGEQVRLPGAAKTAPEHRRRLGVSGDFEFTRTHDAPEAEDSPVPVDRSMNVRDRHPDVVDSKGSLRRKRHRSPNLIVQYIEHRCAVSCQAPKPLMVAAEIGAVTPAGMKIYGRDRRVRARSMYSGVRYTARLE